MSAAPPGPAAPAHRDRVAYRTDSAGWRIRWNHDLAARARASGDWLDRTIADLAAEHVAAAPQQVMLVEGERTFTFGEIHRLATRLAAWFAAIGLQRGDVVSFQLPNWWEAAVIDLAACLRGLVVNPIVAINRDAEVGYMLGEARTRVMFVPATFRKWDHAAMMRRLLSALAPPPRVVVVRGEPGGFDSFDAVLAQAGPHVAPVAVDPDDVKLLMYTSGTTGRPKGVLHSHNTLQADCVKMQPSMELHAGEMIFCASPLTHVTGYLWLLTMPWVGGLAGVTIDVWEPQRAFDMIERHGCVAMFGATPFLQDLLAVVRQRGRTLPSLRQYLCGGAAVPPDLIHAANAVLPHCIAWRNFGATEATTMTRGPARREDARLGAETDGRLYRAEVRIVDVASGTLLPPGEEGEILVREPSMALGYARAEDDEGAYDADGFFRMGDLGRLVEGDHIVCTGRRKDLIIRAGENISAKEIEDVLFKSPKVADVAVVSMPSAKTGEAVCAFIVAAPGAAVGLDEVAGLVRSAGLARQKTPEHVELVEALPKTASGKVRKDVLRERARAFAL